MYPSRQIGGTRRFSRPSKHVPSPSQDTNASGIADSTISYGESLRLSQFPNPPVSIPTTPIVSEFCKPSPGNRPSIFRVPEQKQSLSYGGSSLYTSTRIESPVRSAHSQVTTYHQTKDLDPLAPSTIHALSPYDWHDGASSIGMDATEDQLLSTSFITSLLQENAGSRANRRTSTSSDALSGFSEMTYPPLASNFTNDQTSPHHSPSVRTLPQRPQGGRPPPTAYISIPESLDRLSGDSDTIYSKLEHNTFTFRKASRERVDIGGASVLNHTSAVSGSVDKDGAVPSYRSLSDTPKDIQAPLKYKGSYTTEPLVNDQPLRPTQKRVSTHSTRSGAASFISRISSHRSLRRVMTWRRMKPLPPVPTIPSVPIAAENEHHRADESRSLPELVNRAGALQVLLEKGYHPHESLTSHYLTSKGDGLISAFDDGDTITRETNSVNVPDYNPRPLQDLINQLSQAPGSDRPAKISFPRKKKRIFIILGAFLVVVLAAVGTAVGISVHGKKPSYPVCSGNLVGAACDLNATCVCTSSVSGRCDGLAQNLVDLIPALNRFAHANFTSSVVYKSIWLAQGAMPGRNCASQSRLVDVAPALTPQLFPEQMAWAQTALLWNIVESQNISAVCALRKFIQEAPWKNLESVNPAAFSIIVSGYIFNFATQQVTTPSQSFIDQGQPTSAQISQVGPVAGPTLNRMYGFAVASSTQHRNALLNYWRTVLQQNPADLNRFMAALSASPILLPFDAVSSGPTSASALLQKSPISFPPPLACYPGLSSVEKQSLNLFESQVFGLPTMHTVDSFETSCFPDRPIYGILNVLRLRIPFKDTGPGSARQGVILRGDTSPRVLVYSGETFSDSPGFSNTTTLSPSQLDPHQYGTLGQYNHVVLNYLSSIPDINVAMALVSYVLNSASHLTIPPDSSSILFRSIATIPVLEVAVFGSIGPSDVVSTVSAFSTSSGSLFFGSDQADIFRKWAISDYSSSITWAESALSPVVVRDRNFLDKAFNDTWNAVSLALHHNIQVSLLDVTMAFNATKRFTTS
ncbi:hypothetical protein BDZ94DRAFT_1323782 [Collybia nuda]|uniref:Uncharacterized protein n=1 Tax=Collybia nuda TaxID=64659 RepID=A0A9P5Y3H1_9AGAR|nr:hypothetical protein BDZ94DRAFT_1323782 [Collybia nuda]